MFIEEDGTNINNNEATKKLKKKMLKFTQFCNF